MLTLAFDTSAKTAAVALLKNKEIIYDKIIRTQMTHSEVILPQINEAMEKSGVNISEVDLFACSLGPGSFTGLRVAVSTLKGMILALSKPAVGVSSLAALALNIINTDKLICSVIDAGRGQVYTSLFNYDDAGILQQITPEQAVWPQNVLSKNVNGDVVCVGDGALKYENIIKGTNKSEVIIAQNNIIKASSIGILGLEKCRRNELLNPDNCVPVYLRIADAKPMKVDTI
ncbi:MAG TPA: tRNA (adenosine(37)-N6)-threonylcarbamoyltransferase complex dimerization subunit type 1 TsaB [Deltaproteobacteria bacterium]|nr:tRNA (adenosine(37)-N6)-threonylcarbamoyltransferase complex dimerization subunit type 1 TsaB [Deltaproteobacteria bacterium]